MTTQMGAILSYMNWVTQQRISFTRSILCERKYTHSDFLDSILQVSIQLQTIAIHGHKKSGLVVFHIFYENKIEKFNLHLLTYGTKNKHIKSFLLDSGTLIKS